MTATRTVDEINTRKGKKKIKTKPAVFPFSWFIFLKPRAVGGEERAEERGAVKLYRWEMCELSATFIDERESRGGGDGARLQVVFKDRRLEE